MTRYKKTIMQCRGRDQGFAPYINFGNIRLLSRLRRDSRSCITGFTLLEMIISIGIFSVLVISSIGVMIAVSNAQLKAANVQATQDNIRFGIDLLAKEIRDGFGYALTSHCPGSRPGQELSFTTWLGEQRVYCLSGPTMMRLAGTIDFTRAKPFLADEVTVDRLQFKIGGAVPGYADGQPWVMIALSVTSNSQKSGLASHMDLETMAVQRFRDSATP